MRVPVLRHWAVGFDFEVVVVEEGLMDAEACAAAQSTSRVCTQRPLTRSHCRSVLSAEPETRVSPLKWRAVTSATWAESVWMWQSRVEEACGGGWGSSE